MSPARSAPTGTRLRPAHALLAAALAALALYAHTVAYPFVWDDEVIVVENRQIQSLGNLPRIFTSHAFAGADTALGVSGVAEYYRPAWIASLAVDQAIWKGRAFGFHLTNVLLHALAAVLVAWLALELLGNAAAALVAGALFALHPAHAEAVAWVSARNELLLGAFTVLAFLAYVRWRRRGGAVDAVLAIAAFLVALLSKETAVVLPALALLFEWTAARSGAARAGERGGARRWLGPLALAAVAAAFWAVRSRLVAPLPLPETLGTRLLAAPAILFTDLRLLLVPVGLRVFHLFDPPRSLADPFVAFGLLTIAVLVVLLLRLRRRLPVAALGLGWMLVALLPVSGIAGFPRPTPIAERYLYLPSVGWALLATSVLAPLLASRGARERGAWAVTAAVAVAFAGLALVHGLAWRSPFALMTRLTREAPTLAIGHDGLGLVQRREGRWAEAAASFATAAQLAPDDPRYRFHLAESLERLGRLEDAARVYQDAIAGGIRYPEAWFELGWIEERLGRPDRALAAYREAVRMEPRYDAAMGAAAQVLARLGHAAEAERAYRDALRVRPDDPRHHQNLGALYTTLGRGTEAVAECGEAVRLEPRRPEGRFALAAALLAAHRPAEAEASARAGLSLAPPTAPAMLLLARTLAAPSRNSDAAAAYREAASLAAGDSTTRALAERELAALGTKP